MYEPKPIETGGVQIPTELTALIEELAKHNHDLWAQQRIGEGWTYGTERNDVRKEHPDLVPYEELSEAEKEYDRNAAIGTIKVILSRGYRIVRDS